MDAKQGEDEPKKDTEEQLQENDENIEEIINDAAKDDKKNTYILYRTINNYGVMAGDESKFESIHIKDSGTKKKRKKAAFKLDDKEELSEWLTNNYEAYSMALIIAAAVFDSMPYSWVVQAADLLYEVFGGKEEKEKKTYGLSDTLCQFGVEICRGEMNTYTGKTPVEVVHLVETGYQERILRYFWRECPLLQERIINWLESYSMRKPFSMSKRAVAVIGTIVCWDYYFFLTNIVKRIHKDKSIYTDLLVAQIVIAVNKEETYKENIQNLLYIWSNEHRVHYLLTGLYACVELEDKDDILENFIGRYINKVMKEIRYNESKEYLSNIFDFFAAGMRSFTFYRILIEKMYELVYEDDFHRKKRDLCSLFLKLFHVDIYLAQFEKGEDAIFIKLCMANRALSVQLCYLWQIVWQCRDFRNSFYSMMALYDREVRKSKGCYSVEEFVEKALGEVCSEDTLMDICSKIHRRSKNE